MTLDESKDPQDIVKEAYGVTVVADQKTAQHLEGTVLDYIESEDGSGFKINTSRKPDCGSDCTSGCC